VRFGDGRFGKRPAAGAGFLARLRVGNGPDGLIGADAIGHLLTDDPDVIGGVTNPLPALGGAAPERLTTIKINAPRAFRRQRRAVTAADYAGFAEAHSDVQRATAERRWTGSWHTMFLAVDPVGGRVVDAPFEADLRAHLEPVRLAGHDLEIEPPAYVPLDIALAVCVARGHYAADVARALLDAFGADRRADGAHGFFHPDNFTFGTPVRLSRMIAEAMALPGVQWIGLRLEGIEGEGRFRRLHDQSVDYGDAGVIPIGAREVARLDNDPNAPENGRLRFLMEGGR
jgi:predicted phage baseplate assembly protein